MSASYLWCQVLALNSHIPGRTSISSCCFTCPVLFQASLRGNRLRSWWCSATQAFSRAAEISSHVLLSPYAECRIHLCCGGGCSCDLFCHFNQCFASRTVVQTLIVWKLHKNLMQVNCVIPNSKASTVHQKVMSKRAAALSWRKIISEQLKRKELISLCKWVTDWLRNNGRNQDKTSYLYLYHMWCK